MSNSKTLETATINEQKAAVGFAYAVLSDPSNIAVSKAYEVHDNSNGLTYTYTDLLRALRVLYDSLEKKVLH